MVSTKYLLCALLASLLGFATQANAACNEYDSTAWDDLSEDVQKAANRVGYFRDRWDYNNGKVNPMELVRWSELTKRGQRNEWGWFGKLKFWTRKNVLPIIGYPHPKCYDMYLNHYDGYTWWALGKAKNMRGEKVRPFAITLGWNRTSWEGDIDPPDSDCKIFTELSWNEKQAAIGMGWSRQSWDEFPCTSYCSSHPTYSGNCEA